MTLSLHFGVPVPQRTKPLERTQVMSSHQECYEIDATISYLGKLAYTPLRSRLDVDDKLRGNLQKTIVLLAEYRAAIERQARFATAAHGPFPSAVLDPAASRRTAVGGAVFDVDSTFMGHLEMHRTGQRAKWRGRALPLTTTEFRIVDLLASRPGIDCSYRRIYDLVRGEGFVAGNGADGYCVNVRGAIKRIRKKFLVVDRDFAEIENFRKFGYHWRSNLS